MNRIKTLEKIFGANVFVRGVYYMTEVIAIDSEMTRGLNKHHYKIVTVTPSLHNGRIILRVHVRTADKCREVRKE